MKPYEYYKTNPVPYPNRETFKSVYVYSAGLVVWHGTAEDFNEVRKQYHGNCTETIFDEESYRAARDRYQAEQQRLNDEFYADLLEEHGVTGHPKAQKAYNLAYEYGHSAGYQEVALHFADLVELIKD